MPDLRQAVAAQPAYLPQTRSCVTGSKGRSHIRRVQLQFFDLAVLEEDRLDPGIRLLFVSGLTLTIGLLFWLGVVLITIGKFDTNFVHSGTKAVLIGLLCGIGEKSLSTAVSRRASELVDRIGGAGSATIVPPAPRAVPAPT